MGWCEASQGVQDVLCLGQTVEDRDKSGPSKAPRRSLNCVRALSFGRTYTNSLCNLTCAGRTSLSVGLLCFVQEFVRHCVLKVHGGMRGRHSLEFRQIDTMQAVWQYCSAC